MERKVFSLRKSEEAVKTSSLKRRDERFTEGVSPLMRF
jgi:hypothetical protein